MKILALELSSAQGSVAFWDENETEFVRQFPADRKHSGAFFETLGALGRTCATAEKIVIGLGPGSYAGVRIAIATAIGLQAAGGARLLGLPSICAFDCAEYCVVGDARRGSFYFAHVREGKYVQAPVLGTAAQTAARLNEHRGLPAFSSQPLRQFADVTVAYPSAIVLVQLALNSEPSPNDQLLEPIYLREPYITTPNE